QTHGTAQPDSASHKVARKFMGTADPRNNLDRAYSPVGPDLKGGLTKKQFEKGNIPVISYPAGNLETAGFTVVSSYKTQMMLLVDLVARKGSGANIRPHLPFWGGLVRAHTTPTGHWLTNYWTPDRSPPA